MFSQSALLSSPMASWPTDWPSLETAIQPPAGIPQAAFWQTLVNKYLTTSTLPHPSEEAYKTYFRQFWTVDYPKMKAKPDLNLFFAAKAGYNVYINNALAPFAPEQKAQLLNKLLPSGNTLLHTAIEHHHLLLIKELLAQGADPNQPGLLGQTPLHSAAYFNSEEMINLLLQAGAKIDPQRNDGERPIHIAAMMGKEKAVAALIKQDKHQLKSIGREGRTPFYRASIEGNLVVMNLLLAEGVNAAEINPYTRSTVLHQAAIKNQLAVISFLATHTHLDMNMLDPSGFTPLQRCAMQSNPSLEAASELIVYGANVNAGNPPPISYLTQGNPRAEAFKALLISHGAHFDVAKVNGIKLT